MIGSLVLLSSVAVGILGLISLVIWMIVVDMAEGNTLSALIMLVLLTVCVGGLAGIVLIQIGV